MDDKASGERLAACVGVVPCMRFARHTSGPVPKDCALRVWSLLAQATGLEPPALGVRSRATPPRRWHYASGARRKPRAARLLP